MYIMTNVSLKINKWQISSCRNGASDRNGKHCARGSIVGHGHRDLWETASVRGFGPR